MNNKLINKQIRQVSNFTSLPLLLFAMLTNLFSLLMTPVIRGLYYRGIEIDDDLLTLFSYCVQYLVITAGAVAVFYIIRGRSTGLRFGAMFRKPQKSFGWMAKWYVITAGLSYIASYATSFAREMAEQALGTELETPDFDFGQTPLGTFTMIFSVVILAPVFEELLFRGTVYRSGEVMGQFFAVLLTGFSFGIWHQNFEQFLFTAVMGACSAYVFSQTRSILPCIIYHMLINGTSVFFSSFIGGLDSDIDNVKELASLLSADSAALVMMLIFALYVLAVIHAAIPLLVVELVKNKKQRVLKNSFFPYSGSKRLMVYFSAPVTIITYLYMLAATVYRAIPK